MLSEAPDAISSEVFATSPDVEGHINQNARLPGQLQRFGKPGFVGGVEALHAVEAMLSQKRILRGRHVVETDGEERLAIGEDDALFRQVARLALRRRDGKAAIGVAIGKGETQHVVARRQRRRMILPGSREPSAARSIITPGSNRTLG